MFNKFFSKNKYRVGVVENKEQEVQEQEVPELQTNDVFTNISNTLSNFNSVKTISNEENIKLLEEPRYKFIVFKNFEDEEYNTKIQYYTTDLDGNNLINLHFNNEKTYDNIMLVDRGESQIQNKPCNLNATIFLAKFSSIIRLNMYGLLKESNNSYKKLNNIFECLINSKQNFETLKYINVGGNNIKPIKQTDDTPKKNESIMLKFKNCFSTDFNTKNNNFKNNFKNNDEAEQILAESNFESDTETIHTEPIPTHRLEKVEQYISSENFISDHCFIKIVTVWPDLEELNISDNQIDNFYILQKILGSKIKKINVANNNIINNNNKDNHNILQSLFENYIITSKSIVSLNIIGNNFDIVRIVSSLGMKNFQLTKISIEKISRPIFGNLINNIKNKNIEYLSISNTVINNIPVIEIDDKYLTNYNIKEYLQKYLYKDKIGYFSDPQIQSYIHHLNDETLGNQSILIKNLTLDQRKYKLLDIINFHKILMSLTPYETKILLSTMKSYTINSKSYSTSTTKGVNASIGFGPLQGPTLGVTSERGESVNILQTLTSSAPWEQYGINYDDAMAPIKVLNTLILANNISTNDFTFFNNNKNNLKMIIDKLQFTKELCQMIKINSSLQNLNLSYCKLNKFTIKKICESLKDNNTLKSINLSNNDFDIDCWYHIINFIENPCKSVIKNLNLLDNNTNDKNTLLNLSNSLIMTKKLEVFYYDILKQDFYETVNTIRVLFQNKEISFLKEIPIIISNNNITFSETDISFLKVGGKLNNNYVKINKEKNKKYSKKKNKKISKRKNKKHSKRKNKKIYTRKNKKIYTKKNKKHSKKNSKKHSKRKNK